MYWSTRLPEFICRFLRRIYYDSATRVEFAGMTRGQFLMARSVRQGCPASGFLFSMAFHPIFRWLQDVLFPRNLAGLDFLQPAGCAYAFKQWNKLAGLNLNHRKCCWVQYGSERRESLLNWFSDNCEDFR